MMLTFFFTENGFLFPNHNFPSFYYSQIFPSFQWFLFHPSISKTRNKHCLQRCTNVTFSQMTKISLAFKCFGGLLSVNDVFKDLLCIWTEYPSIRVISVDKWGWKYQIWRMRVNLLHAGWILINLLYS